MLFQCYFLYLNSVTTEMMADFGHLSLINIKLQNAEHQVDYCSDLVDMRAGFLGLCQFSPTWSPFSRACHTIHYYCYVFPNSLPSCPVLGAITALRFFGFHYDLHCLQNSQDLISWCQLLCFLINRTWKEGMRYNHCC